MKSLLFIGAIVLSVLPDINEAATFSESNGLLRRLLYQRQIPQQQMSQQINGGKVYKCGIYGDLCVNYFDGCNKCDCTDTGGLRCTQQACVGHVPELKCTECIFGYVPDIDGECRQIPQQKTSQQQKPQQQTPQQQQIPQQQMSQQTKQEKLYSPGYGEFCVEYFDGECTKCIFGYVPIGFDGVCRKIPQQYNQYTFVFDDSDFSEYSDLILSTIGYCKQPNTDNSLWSTQKQNGEIFNEPPECVYDSFIFIVNDSEYNLVGSTRPWKPTRNVVQSCYQAYTDSLPVIEGKEYYETFDQPDLPAGSNQLHFTVHVKTIGGEDC